jgi:hypothetical protein
VTEKVGNGYDKKEVGHSLESATSVVGGVRICFPDDVNVVLVDTPGFDDAERTDRDVLKAIASWLRRSV